MKRELARLVRRLIDIASVIKNNVESISKDQHPNDNEGNPPPHRDSEITVTLPVAVTDYYKSENRDGPGKKLRDRWRLGVEAATLVAALAAAIFAYRSFGEVKRQAESTQKQLEHSIESFRVDERAWLEIEPPGPVLKMAASPAIGGALFTYDFYLKNVGKTAAFNIAVRAPRASIDSGIELGDNPRGIALLQKQIMTKGFFGGVSPSDEIILLSERNAKTLGPAVRAFSPFQLYGQEPRFQRYRFLVGRIDYEDAFSISHWTTFCFYVDTGGALRYCREGNEEDKNPETPPIK